MRISLRSQSIWSALKPQQLSLAHASRPDHNGARLAALLLASRALAVTTAAVVQHPVRGEEGDRTACQSTCRGAESSPLEPSSVSSKASALMSTASSTDRPYPAAWLCGHRSHLPASRYVD